MLAEAPLDQLSWPRKAHPFPFPPLTSLLSPTTTYIPQAAKAYRIPRQDSRGIVQSTQTIMLTTTGRGGGSTAMTSKPKERFQLTREQKDEFTTSFQLFDTEGKNTIDLHELKVGFLCCGGVHVKERDAGKHYPFSATLIQVIVRRSAYRGRWTHMAVLLAVQQYVSRTSACTFTFYPSTLQGMPPLSSSSHPSPLPHPSFAT